MNRTIQLYNTFRNRWCGAFFASKGIRVIPTVNWGNEDTFSFSFDGIEHRNHGDQKEFFMKGYRELLQRIEPEFVLCYHTPFPEMEGNIIPISYERSSWRYLSYHPEVNESDFDTEANKIGGAEQLSCDIMEPYMVSAGSGSAYGGPWKPKYDSASDAPRIETLWRNIYARNSLQQL